MASTLWRSSTVGVLGWYEVCRERSSERVSGRMKSKHRGPQTCIWWPEAVERKILLFHAPSFVVSAVEEGLTLANNSRTSLSESLAILLAICSVS